MTPSEVTSACLSKCIGQYALSLQAADSFLGNASVQQTLANELGSASKSNLMVLFNGHVPSDLEAIFCRGSEWDSGAEHAFIFKVSTGAFL